MFCIIATYLILSIQPMKELVVEQKTSGCTADAEHGPGHGGQAVQQEHHLKNSWKPSLHSHFCIINQPGSPLLSRPWFLVAIMILGGTSEILGLLMYQFFGGENQNV